MLITIQKKKKTITFNIFDMSFLFASKKKSQKAAAVDKTIYDDR